jgi:beta-amylase
MSFHACEDSVRIPLPDWVTNIGNGNSDIFYKDADGDPDREYLSWAIDEEPLANGLTSIQVYQKFMEQFRTEMNAYFGEPQVGETTKKGKITKIEVGLGPSGELRYPGYRRVWTIGPPAGIGEFQCYDEYMTTKWKNEATNQGFTIPCRVGPQTAGDYNSTPGQTQFFQTGAGLTNGISYTETYGKAFLTWYSKNLVDHGRRVLEIADEIFKPAGVEIAAKVPGIYWYCNHPSRAAEATTGLFTGDNPSVYDLIAGMLQEMGATFIFTCVEKEDVAGNNTDRPQGLVQEVLGAAQLKGASRACENGSEVPDEDTYNRIIGVALTHNISYFTYMRLGSELMTNPAHFGRFQRFVNGMNGT